MQLVFLVLYLVGAVHTSFFSLSGRDPIEARHLLLSTWLPLLLPIWIVDGEMNRRGALRLFVWPRAGLRSLLSGYVLARSLRAIILTVTVALITLNTGLVRDGATASILLACGVLGLFGASFVMFCNVVAGSKTVYPAIYAMAVVLLWALSRLADSRFAVEAAQSLLMPVWLLDPVEATSLIGTPLHLLQALSASTFWFAASCFILRRSYR
ncbi:MAG: hypothetical protein OEY69_01215 [Candidatus Krumholzibacteria bacterium]|nr:hypothetical protein [Candidatus Krumholzibacteria bacterium]